MCLEEFLKFLILDELLNHVVAGLWGRSRGRWFVCVSNRFTNFIIHLPHKILGNLFPSIYYYSRFESKQNGIRMTIMSPHIPADMLEEENSNSVIGRHGAIKHVFEITRLIFFSVKIKRQIEKIETYQTDVYFVTECSDLVKMVSTLT